MKQRLWLTVHGADLTNPASLTRLAVDFALAPAREAWGLPAPRPDERDDFLFVDIDPIAGLPARMMRSHQQRISAAYFEPVLHGLLLFGWLFPGANFVSDTPEEVVRMPGHAFLTDSQLMAYRRHEEIAYLAAGALGSPALPPLSHGPGPFQAQASPAALAELRAMQELIERAIGEPDDSGDYRRINLGFDWMDAVAADEIDEILRRDVHERLIWLGDFELSNPAEDDDDSIPLSAGDFITFDRGVLPALVPESLSGLIRPRLRRVPPARPGLRAVWAVSRSGAAHAAAGCESEAS